MAELLARPEHARVDPVEDRPQLRQAVLHRRAGEGDALAGAQLAHGAGRSGGRVLDELRLVEHDGRPGDLGEDVEVAGEQAVGRDDEIAGREHGRRLAAVVAVGAVALGAVVDGDGHRRREAAGLGLPVVDDRERADDEVRARSVDEVGERGRRLAEPHVVGEAAAEAEAVEESQPAEAAALVGPQLAGERGRLDLLAQRRVGQPAEQQPGPRRRD